VNATFVYDGLGRREKKTINGNLTEFLYDGLNPVQETAGTTVLANVLPGLGVDEFLTRTDVVAGVTSNFLADALGSPVAVTDNAGIVQTEYTYESFGKTSLTGASNSSSYQYTGRENDGTGLFYYRNRYFHPRLQRFVSEDPITFAGNDINLYGYVGNNPTKYVDPFGLWGVGIQFGAQAEGGLGALGGGAQIGAGVGAFFTDANNVNVGAFAEGGGFAFNHGYPGDKGVAIGGSAGYGAFGFFTNAKCAKDLAGPFYVASLNVGLGPFKFSAQYASDGKTFIASFSPPGWGNTLGASGSLYQTNTIAIGTSRP
jgi:RHS repeat-associated protein